MYNPYIREQGVSALDFAKGGPTTERVSSSAAEVHAECVVPSLQGCCAGRLRRGVIDPMGHRDPRAPRSFQAFRLERSQPLTRQRSARDGPKLIGLAGNASCSAQWRLEVASVGFLTSGVRSSGECLIWGEEESRGQWRTPALLRLFLFLFPSPSALIIALVFLSRRLGSDWKIVTQ